MDNTETKSSTEDIQKLSASQIMEMQDAGATLYVRWSRGPEHDTEPSRDYANGGAHGGLSAVLLGQWDESCMIRRLGEYRFLRLKDELIAPYIYTGKMVGADSDGYDLLDVDSVSCVGRWSEEIE